MINYKLLTGILSLILITSLTTPAFAQVTDFYWSEDTPGGDEIFTADAATQTVGQVTSGGFARIDDVEIDPLANKLWWNNWAAPTPSASEGLYTSNLDGTGQLQVTSGAQSNTGNQASGLHGIVLDPSNQVVFFTRGVSYANNPYGEVSRVNMDGTGYAQLNSPLGESWFPSGIERVGNTLYWGNPGVLVFGFADGAVNSMDTSGGNLQVNLVPHTDGHGRSIAVDSAKGLLFYSTYAALNPASGGAIYVYDLINGGAPTLVLNDPTTGIPDIELDTASMRIYWTDFANGEIRSASYDAAGNMSPFSTEISGLLNPFGLALVFSKQVVGGESLSIDNSALLLAGISNSAIWMIPTLAGIAGAGFYLVRFRTTKE